MRRFVFSAVLGSALALPAAVRADVVNFHDSNNGVGTFAGQGAAPDAGNNVWNGFTDSGKTVTGALNSSGAATPVTFTATYNFNNGVVNATDQGAPQFLLGNQAGVNGANPLGSFTLANVPAGVYDIYLYGTNFDHNRGTTFALNAANGGVAHNGVASTLNTTISSFQEGDNYVVFNGVQPDASGTISGTYIPNPADGVGNPNLSGEGSLNGIQLVAVPEPGSLALLGLASVGLLARRRRA